MRNNWTILKVFNERKANHPACHYTHLSGLKIHTFDANSDPINDTNKNNIKTLIVYSFFCVLDYVFCSFVFVHRAYKGKLWYDQKCYKSMGKMIVDNIKVELYMDQV